MSTFESGGRTFLHGQGMNLIFFCVMAISLVGFFKCMSTPEVGYSSKDMTAQQKLKVYREAKPILFQSVPPKEQGARISAIMDRDSVRRASDVFRIIEEGDQSGWQLSDDRNAFYMNEPYPKDRQMAMIIQINALRANR